MTQTCRETIGNILNSSDSIIDGILERAGIGLVPGIEPPPRRAAEDTSEDESQVEFDPSLRASEAREASLSASGRLETPSPSDFTEDRSSFYPHDLHSGSPSLTYPRGYEPSRGIAYQELLDNVIRIARSTALPRNGDLASPSNGQFHENFDHEAAFGIRSQGEMRYNMKIGAAGELFVCLCPTPLSNPFSWRLNYRYTNAS